MNCNRCGGVMTYERFYGPQEHFCGWRCVYCGEILDEVILENRQWFKKEEDRMKVVALNGSSCRDGNTALLLNFVLDELEKEGVETELIQLARETLSGCIACYKCGESENQKCAVISDRVNEYIAKMQQAQGILLGSPTYISDMTANMKALIERSTIVSR